MVLSWILCVVLLIVSVLLSVKIYLMKKSMEEICAELEEHLSNDTNALLTVSSADRHIRKFSDGMNVLLRRLYKERHRYLMGNQELKESVTNISHDLRTPLTSILGYLKLLENENCSFAEREKYLFAIKNRTQTLKQLTEELFHYTMAASDEEELQLKRLSLNEMLENSISSYYSILKQKKIVPKIVMPEQKIMGLANENALSRVLGNIINNAVKYSDGDLNVVLTENGEISFSNHASELTEVQVERLFDRFYTVNLARKSTGLGLAISKTLMEKMGGTIAAEFVQGVLTIRLKFG